MSGGGGRGRRTVRKAQSRIALLNILLHDATVAKLSEDNLKRNVGMIQQLHLVKLLGKSLELLPPGSLLWHDRGNCSHGVLPLRAGTPTDPSAWCSLVRSLPLGQVLSRGGFSQPQVLNRRSSAGARNHRDEYTSKACQGSGKSASDASRWRQTRWFARTRRSLGRYRVFGMFGAVISMFVTIWQIPIIPEIYANKICMDFGICAVSRVVLFSRDPRRVVGIVVLSRDPRRAVVRSSNFGVDC